MHVQVDTVLDEEPAVVDSLQAQACSIRQSMATWPSRCHIRQQLFPDSTILLMLLRKSVVQALT